MKLTRTGRAAALGLTLALSLAACGSDEGQTGGSSEGGSSDLSGTLDGAGASSQQAAMQAWQAGFQSLNSDVTVNYDPQGSGAGREQFLAGAIAFAGSDAYLKDDELAKAEEMCGTGNVVELPNYISPIAVIFNLDGVESLNLKPGTIAQIFDGKIKNWNDAAIKADNPDATLPDLAITPVHRSDDSGTTENFTDYLGKASEDWSYEADGEWPKDGGESAQGTSGVVAAVKAGKGAIGYADASQAGDLGTVHVGVGNEFVEYSPEAAAKVLEESTKVSGRGQYDLAYDLARDTEEAGVYPVVLVSYHVTCVTPKKSPELTKAFLQYVVSADGQKAAADAAGSAPISEALRTEITPAVEAMSAG